MRQFYVFYLFIKYCFGGGDQFGTGYQVIKNCIIISEGVFIFKVNIRGFFAGRGCEVVSINESI